MTFIDAHTHKAGAIENVLKIYNLSPGAAVPSGIDYFSYGLHPWNISNEQYEEELLVLEQVLAHNKCVAVGEAGLDRLTKAPFELQMQLFLAQIVLAEKHGKPLIVHCVRAFSDLVHLIKKVKPGIPIVLHAYNQNTTISKSLLPYNIYFSLGKELLKQGSKARKALPELPVDRLFFETDDADVPIEDIYHAAASVLKVEEEFLIEQIKNNFAKIFSIKKNK